MAVKNTPATGLLIFCVSMIILFVSPVSSAAEQPLILAVHPYKSPAKLVQAFTPFADYLAKRLSREVQIKVTANYAAHIDAVGRDAYDIAYMGPASYVKAVARYGRKPLLSRLVVNGKPTFQGKIIVREDSAIRELPQLKGKRFAFGDRSSTMSHLVPRFMLIEAGINAEELEEYQFLGSHDNVALAVLVGDYDAGAVKEAVFYKYQKKGLRSLASTPVLSEHLFVASKVLDPKQIERIRQEMFAMQNTPEGRKALRAIKSGITALGPVEDSDYKNLKEILQELQKTGVVSL